MELNLAPLSDEVADDSTLEDEFLKMVADLEVQSVEMEEEGMYYQAPFI